MNREIFKFARKAQDAEAEKVYCSVEFQAQYEAECITITSVIVSEASEIPELGPVTIGGIPMQAITFFEGKSAIALKGSEIVAFFNE